MRKMTLCVISVCLVLCLITLVTVSARGCQKRNSKAKSGSSNADAFNINAPVNLTGTVVSLSQINLSWDDNSANNDGFLIERQLQYTDWVEVGTTSDGITSYSDNTALPGNTYLYRVRATNIIGDRSSPSNEITLTTTSEWLAISAGRAHVMALRRDNTIWSWGDNEFGQLGLGGYAPTTVYVPTQIDTDSDWALIASGHDHSLGVKIDGTLWAWGANQYGQAGIGDSDAIPDYPTQVGTDSDWSMVVGGESHTLAIKSNRTLWSCGRNDYGQLGIGDNLDADYPFQSGTDSDWSYIAAGNNCSFGIKTNQTLWSWGYNYFGQLGLGATGFWFDRNTPTQVGTDSDWSMLTAGYSNVFGLKNNGTLLGWGASSYQSSGTIPTIVGTDTDWVAISINRPDSTDPQRRYHSVAIKTNGTIWSWGNNDVGQLGLGDMGYDETRYVPTQIGYNAEWIAATAGRNFSIGLTRDGLIWRWGFNYNGSLGLGTTGGYYKLRPTLPNQPIGLASITSSSSQINISWSDMQGENGYKIERKLSLTGGWVQIATVGSSVTSYSDTGLTRNTTYYYRVRPYYVAGDGSPSIEVFGTPVLFTPYPVSAFVISTTQLNISWGDNSIDETGFIIERKTGVGGTWGEVATVNQNITSYIDQGLTVGTQYYYRIAAFNASGQGDYSLDANAIPALLAPSNLYIAAATSTQMNISWSDNSIDEDGFKLERKIAGISDQWSEIATVSADINSYPDIFGSPIEKNTVYYYRVKSYKASLESDYTSGYFILGGDCLDISSGSDHTIALKTDGTIWSWGLNQGGQLGLGDTVDRFYPVNIGTGTDWSKITTGYSHSLGIKTNNTLWYWGSTPTQIGNDSDWINAKGGLSFTIALKSNGTLWSWGWNHVGQLGLNDLDDRATPTQIGTDSDWLFFAAGRLHSVAIKTSGTLWVWGFGLYGQLGDGTGSNRWSPVPIGTQSDWDFAVGGANSTIAKKNDGTIWAWGNNAQLVLSYELTPISISTDTDWSKIVMRGDNVLALKNDGLLWVDFITTINNDTDWSMITNGSGHSLAIKTNNTIWGWGSNNVGQLGMKNDTFTAPRKIGVDADWSMIACGNNYTIGIKQNKTRWGFGSNDGNQLGNGTVTTGYTPPIQLGTINDWNIVFAGDSHAFGIKTNNSSWAWGWNQYSQLGLGDGAPNPVNTPAQMDGNWSSISAGNQNSLGIRTDGTIWSWGYQGYGQDPGAGQLGLGLGWGVLKNTPNQIGSDSDWEKGIAGLGHTIAMKTNGTLWTWGCNVRGQLGLGDTADRNVPVQVGTLSDWSNIAAGSNYSATVKNNGTIWSWGNNDYGQLGLGSTGTNRKTPTSMGTISDWSQIFSRYSHTIAIKTDRSIWGWGFNSDSQLGLNDTADRNKPAFIGTDMDWSYVVVGLNYSIGLKTNNTIWGWGNTTLGQLGSPIITSKYVPTLCGFFIPVAPKSLNATAYTWVIGLTWIDDTVNEAGVKIERTTNPDGFWDQIALLGPNVISYSDDTISLGTRYYYRVRFYNSFGDSDYSNQSNAIVNSPAITLSVNLISSSQVDLSWTNISGEEGYKIERKTGAGGTYAQIATTATDAVTYSDMTVTFSNIYYYKVRAYNGSSNTDYSSPVSVDIWTLGITALTATAISSSRIDIDWTDVTEETGYKIERKIGVGGVYAQVATTAADTVSYSDTAAAPGNTYYYRVRASSAGGDSGYSPSANAITYPGAPGAITVTAVSSTQIIVSWSDVTAETGYKIERKFGVGGVYAQIATASADVISYSDTAVTPSNTYYYQVRAYNGIGDGAYSSSASATTPPIAIGALTATAISSSRIDLDWTDVSGETGYKIERSPDGVTYTQIATCGADVFLYSDTTGLAPSATFYYKVCAYNAGGNSGYSPVANATTPDGPPSAPVALTSAAISSSRIDIDWTDVGGETGYKIERKFEVGGVYAQIATASADVIFYSDTAVTASNTYYYRVRSYNGNGDSVSYSPETNASTASPSAPAALTATAISSSIIDINWTDVSYETGYKIERKLGIGGVYAQIATTAVDAVSYSDTAVTASNIYYYQVRAYNAVGDGSYSPSANATTLSNSIGKTILAAGYSHTLCIKTDSTLWVWGYGDFGQLGDPAIIEAGTPYQVGTGSNWLSIAAATYHSLGLKNDSTLWAWGYNSSGQLGLGDSTDRYTPTQIGSDSDWLLIVSEGSHVIGLKNNNSLWAWGSNQYGQLGLGDTGVVNNRNTPTQINSETDWSRIVAGNSHTLSIKTNSTLWVWGYNQNGQLGLGNSGAGTQRATPTQINSAQDWSRIAAGGSHSLGIKTNGTIWSWGLNTNYQLGLGDTGTGITRMTPTLIGTQSDWSIVIAKGACTFAIKSDSTLWAWGVNSVGQLGLGDSGAGTQRRTPTQINSDSDWLAISGGGSGFTVARKTNNTLWAWGLNDLNQLGLGDYENRTTPTLVGE